MNILVTLNSGYVYPLTVMLHSLMKTNPKETFTLYVAHSSLTANDFAKIRLSVDPLRCRTVPVFIDNGFFDSLPCKSRLSKETYYRLFAAEFLPESINRILYLDPDIVINGSLSQLYNIDFGSNLFAAASHNNSFLNFVNRRRLKMDKNSLYVNAGVILMNVEKLRKERSTAALSEYIRKNEASFLLEDQDVFNGFFGSRTVYLDPNKYNLDELTFKRLSKKRGAKNAAAFVENQTVIIHFNGKEKPWNENYSGRLGAYFEKNLDRRKNECEIYKEIG